MRNPIGSAGLVALLALAACGGESLSDPVDAAPVDQIDPGPQQATITVTLSGDPAAGVDVVFGNADGSVGEHSVTGPDGSTTRDIEAGGYITVVPGTGALATFSKVQPGDMLAYELDASATSAGTVTVTLPGAVIGATNYNITTGCAAGNTADPATPVVIDINNRCLDGSGEMAVFAIASDGAGVLAATSLGDIAVRAAGGDAQATLPAWNAAFQTLDVDVVNLDLGGAHIRVVPAAGEAFDDVVFARGTIASFDGLTVSYPIDPRLGDFLRYSIGIGRPDVDLGALSIENDQVDFRAQASSQLTASIDLASDPLEQITELAVDITDPLRPIASHGSASGTPATDVVFYGLTIPGSTWNLMGPGNEPSLQAPDLPEPLRARWQPTGDVGINVIAANHSDFANYDELRRGLAFALIDPKPPMEGAGSSVSASLGFLKPTMSTDPARLLPTEPNATEPNALPAWHRPGRDLRRLQPVLPQWQKL